MQFFLKFGHYIEILNTTRFHIKTKFFIFSVQSLEYHYHKNKTFSDMINFDLRLFKTFY